MSSLLSSYIFLQTVTAQTGWTNVAKALICAGAILVQRMKTAHWQNFGVFFAAVPHFSLYGRSNRMHFSIF